MNFSDWARHFAVISFFRLVIIKDWIWYFQKSRVTFYSSWAWLTSYLIFIFDVGLSVANPDEEVRSSGTVRCRIVCPSARPDLRIRIRHRYTYVTVKYRNRTFLAFTVDNDHEPHCLLLTMTMSLTVCCWQWPLASLFIVDNDHEPVAIKYMASYCQYWAVPVRNHSLLATCPSNERLP
jgi:hypothetical protein